MNLKHIKYQHTPFFPYERMSVVYFNSVCRSSQSLVHACLDVKTYHGILQPLYNILFESGV